jgi:hypothetical protein
MKNLIIIPFLIFSLNLVGQVNLDSVKIQIMNEFNRVRDSLGLKKFVWNNDLVEWSKKTNKVLSKTNKLYHPEHGYEFDKSIFSKLKIEYFKITKNENLDPNKFKNTSQCEVYGEICQIGSCDYKEICRRFYNSPSHYEIIKIFDSEIGNERISPFFSCDIVKSNESYIITCNMYTIFIDSRNDYFSKYLGWE